MNADTTTTHARHLTDDERRFLEMKIAIWCLREYARGNQLHFDRINRVSLLDALNTYSGDVLGTVRGERHPPDIRCMQKFVNRMRDDDTRLTGCDRLVAGELSNAMENLLKAVQSGSHYVRRWRPVDERKIKCAYEPL